MSKHTKGPWEVSKSAPTMRENGQPFIVVGESKFNRIAGVFGAGAAGTQAAIANARLIAAAPLLLEALEMVMDRLVDRHESDEAAVFARAAIAAATGDA